MRFFIFLDSGKTPLQFVGQIFVDRGVAQRRRPGTVAHDRQRLARPVWFGQRMTKLLRQFEARDRRLPRRGRSTCIRREESRHPTARNFSARVPT